MQGETPQTRERKLQQLWPITQKCFRQHLNIIYLRGGGQRTLYGRRLTLRNLRWKCRLAFRFCRLAAVWCSPATRAARERPAGVPLRWFEGRAPPPQPNRHGSSDVSSLHPPLDLAGLVNWGLLAKGVASLISARAQIDRRPFSSLHSYFLKKYLSMICRPSSRLAPPPPPGTRLRRPCSGARRPPMRVL